MAATSAPPGTSLGQPNLPWSINAVDAASHGSIAFCQIYYEAYDEPSRRVRDIPQLYLPGATIVWNGNRISSERDKLAQFLDAVPFSRHDPQTLDCHPIASLDPASGPAPDLIVNITGSVLHGPAAVTLYVSSRGPNVAPRDMPRKFHEVFVLRAAEQEENMQPKVGIRVLDPRSTLQFLRSNSFFLVPNLQFPVPSSQFQFPVPSSQFPVPSPSSPSRLPITVLDPQSPTPNPKPKTSPTNAVSAK